MSLAHQSGKARRIKKLFSPVSGRTLLIPLDDILITGPSIGMGPVGPKIELIAQNPPNAIIGFPGLFINFSDLLTDIPGVLNVTASTIRSQHTRKILVGTVTQAAQLGLEAVAVHVNIGSKYEPEMLAILGLISRECDSLGMPLLAIMYPRSEKEGGDETFEEIRLNDRKRYAELVAHAASVGVELGADIIKTRYTGDPDSFRFVVEACSPIPVVIAGGQMVEPIKLLEMAYDAINSGCMGISFGRNIVNRPDPRSVVTALKAVVHENVKPITAREMFWKDKNPE